MIWDLRRELDLLCRQIVGQLIILIKQLVYEAVSMCADKYSRIRSNMVIDTQWTVEESPQTEIKRSWFYKNTRKSQVRATSVTKTTPDCRHLHHHRSANKKLLCMKDNKSIILDLNTIKTIIPLPIPKTDKFFQNLLSSNNDITAWHTQ